ncbi:hypothetical protein ACFORL_07605 [Legionella dresdenensis]|uniref:Uncharacterized protein n=1 Tax=Legionella dresdenensis TaxID=450200 RepID=A0ABV8CFC2_9GAMM
MPSIVFKYMPAGKYDTHIYKKDPVLPRHHQQPIGVKKSHRSAVIRFDSSNNTYNNQCISVEIEVDDENKKSFYESLLRHISYSEEFIDSNYFTEIDDDNFKEFIVNLISSSIAYPKSAFNLDEIRQLLDVLKTDGHIREEDHTTFMRIFNKLVELKQKNINETTIKSTLFKSAFVRLGMREGYEKSKKISHNTGMFMLDNCLEELNKQKQFLDLIEELSSLIKEVTELSGSEELNQQVSNYDYELSDSRYRISLIEDFFETEYFKLDPTQQTMPPYLREKIKSIQSSPFDNAQCFKSLFYTVVFLSTEDGIKQIPASTINSISQVHNHAFVDFLIGKAFLNQAKSNIIYFEKAVNLLLKNSVETRTDCQKESEEDTVLFKEALSKEISAFVQTQKEPVVKCALIRAKIEDKLKNTLTSTPWALGWAGSRYSIELGGNRYSVPEGIYKLYYLTEEPEANYNQVQSLISQKVEKAGSVFSFFSRVLGNARSEQTQADYDEYNAIISKKFDN